MRKEPFELGDYVHVYNRGNRKMSIFYDENDKWRFLKILRYFNDEYSSQHIFRDLNKLRKFDFYKPFIWPPGWPNHKPLVKILCFCLMPNHFHLLLKEIRKGGITKFMQRLGIGFTNFINIKHNVTGRLFQGSYKGKTVREIRYLQYLSVYIQVINVFELYNGGIEAAFKNFDKAFEWAISYKFSSLPDFIGKRDLSIIDKDIFKEMFSTPESYKEIVRDAILIKDLRKMLGKLTID